MFELKLNSKLKAFSLAEMLITIALFSMLVFSLSYFAVDSIRFSQNRWYRVQAGLQIQESINALSMNKTDLWKNIVDNTNAGNKYMQYSGGNYIFASGNSSSNGINTSFQIANVNRDASGNIVSSGGTIDLNTRSVNFIASWTDRFGITNTITSTIYLSNWSTLNFKDTTTADFNKGATDGFTYIDSANGGEVRLQSVVYADWCKPNISSTAYDLPGNGIAQGITAIPGNAFVGTGANASGVSYANVVIDNNDPPNVTVPGTFDGYKTNAVFGESGYAYIATDTNAEEVVIISLASVPYTKVGWFNAPGNGSGDSVAAANNIGFMTSGSKFYAFDLSSKTGSRSQLGSSVNLAGNGTRIVINGSYAFVSTTSSTTQMQIIDISNTSSMSVVGQASVAGLGGKDLYINSAGTRAYLATASSSTQREVFIIDISTKTGNRPTLGSYDTVGMNPTGIVLVPDNTPRVIVVGSGGEQYQVINTANEATPIRCGGTTISTGVNGIASVIAGNGNAYSYIVTGNSSAELQIIKGGPGGGNGLGQGYAVSGVYTSGVFDTASATVNYYATNWTPIIPAGTTLKLQFRSGTTSDLSAASWVGPDGTAASYFTISTGEYLPAAFLNKRYFQYKAYLSSDTISTPVLQDIKINYQK